MSMVGSMLDLEITGGNGGGFSLDVGRGPAAAEGTPGASDYACGCVKKSPLTKPVESVLSVWNEMDEDTWSYVQYGAGIAAGGIALYGVLRFVRVIR